MTGAGRRSARLKGITAEGAENAEWMDGMDWMDRFRVFAIGARARGTRL